MRKGLAIGLLLAALGGLGAEPFRFLYRPGEKYRLVTEVNESVYVNGSFSHRAEILNRIAVEVLEIRGDRGRLACTFQTSERAFGAAGSFSMSEDYRSEFWRDGRGAYEIDASFFMPVVRDAPLFPEETIEPGASWTAAAEEVHDFRRSFGLPEPFRFPITVHYAFQGRETLEGRELAIFSLRYNFFQSAPPAVVLQRGPAANRPVKLAGSSEQLLRWDVEAGNPHSYEETFDFIFYLASGDSVEYTGSARGYRVDAPRLDREKMVQEIRRDIERQGIPDAEVRGDERGVTITLENIQFPPDSFVLAGPEKEKLRRIGDILRRYAERDVLITGHTARVGTEESSQRLSEQRSKAVADYLLALGVRRPNQIVSRGLGSRQPLADNTTEEGRRLNRRVEITILEN